MPTVLAKTGFTTKVFRDNLRLRGRLNKDARFRAIVDEEVEAISNIVDRLDIEESRLDNPRRKGDAYRRL